MAQRTLTRRDLTHWVSECRLRKLLYVWLTQEATQLKDSVQTLLIYKDVLPSGFGRHCLGQEGATDHSTGGSRCRA